MVSTKGNANDAFSVDVSGQIKFESRWYPERGAWPGQARRDANGLVFEPKVYIENSRGWSFNLSPFVRLEDTDAQRSHVDVREAYFLMFDEFGASEWELRLGVDHVFWGVGESINLVDIINQSDTVEDPFGKIKLGQWMSHLTLAGDWGVLEFFYLPEHRVRNYPGINGRLRSQFVVNNHLATYEAGSGDNHDDYALRYSHYIGVAEFGVSVFDGTSREPKLQPVPVVSQNGNFVLAPHYEQIKQYGLDVSASVNEILLKLEAIHRSGGSNLLGNKDDYEAYLLGGEYTFYSVFGSNLDMTVFGEWLYDERGALSTNTFQNELFLANRIALNDFSATEFTVALLKDRDFQSSTLSLEFKRRINDDWSLEIEGVKFLESDPKDVAQYQSHRDGYVNLSLVYGF